MKVREALKNLMQNRTSVVIAHRLLTVKDADKIVVIHNGEVVNEGTHAELIAKEGIYSKLHQLEVF